VNINQYIQYVIHILYNKNKNKMEKILTIEEQIQINNMLAEIKLSADKMMTEKNIIYSKIDEITNILNG